MIVVVIIIIIIAVFVHFRGRRFVAFKSRIVTVTTRLPATAG